MSNAPLRFDVSTSRLPAIADELAKLGKRAAEFSLGAVDMTEIGPRVAMRGIALTTGGYARERENDHNRHWPHTWDATTIVVTLPDMADGFRLPGGWTLLGVVERSGVLSNDGVELNEIRAVPGAADLSAYRATALECDHCKANRRRKSIVVVQGADGTRVRLGLQCVRDFLGDTVEKIVRDVSDFINGVSTFVAGCGDEDGGYGCRGRSSESTYSARDLASAACHCALRVGWVSRAQSRENGKTATADAAARLQVRPAQAYGEARYEYERRLAQWQSEVDAWKADTVAAGHAVTAFAKLDEAAARVRASDPTLDDFGYSVGTAWAQGFVDTKGAGIIAARAAFVVRDALKATANAEGAAAAEARRAADALLPPPAFVGTVDAKWTGQVEVVRIRTFDGAFGLRVIVALRELGTRNALVWFASGWSPVILAGLAGKDCTPAVGPCRVSLKVKRQADGKYGPETTVSHVKYDPTAEEIAAAKAVKKAEAKAKRDAAKAAKLAIPTTNA
jgi:hypothetical protein